MLIEDPSDRRQVLLACDAEGCPNRLGMEGFPLGGHPLPSTDWLTVKAKGRRLDYCPDHAAPPGLPGP